ncbi:hypothetical protein AEQ67_06405 [Pseudomonas sp. RIT-PI-q]|uniref:hypothetical protein n=1 Tax=Pseudomonas sp. RIT-PI-q TaxID=1690247 RepID=UPI0006CDBEF6|nr:hypothetical protein [Pseudomonas sp. RIT-PI-q]KPH00937.1 hypothetical protein AEQ67_06405 [Pseudomonas sp. RIT-PI-q]
MSLLKAAVMSIVFTLPTVSFAEGGSDKLAEWHLRSKKPPTSQTVNTDATKDRTITQDEKQKSTTEKTLSKQ